ncbi:MAG: sn-glycerol-1-phosphate dehydrogenase [Ruminococcaceae bacterium]|nr:sn-glycerol-1-phosphate dehydrogenase [Oscillospiraceae bacterium]
MDLNNLLQGVPCSCGKHHVCDIEAIYIEKDAIRHLSELCEAYQSVLLVADENTFAAAGEQVCAVLGDKADTRVIFSGSKILIPDEAAIEAVQASLAGVDLIVGIGSGVIQDLCKCVAHFAELPYMIVATAPSMDGYASNGAAMILKGMKETVPAGLPRAIIADVDVLKEAPFDMIQAGYGDVIGKFSALCDWELSRIVTGEYFCQYIYDTTCQMIEKVLSTAKGLVSREEASIKALTEALMVVGVMMSFAGSSRPASGSEHHLSHFFEIVGIVKNEPYFPHGIDVAYGTVVTAEIREKLLGAKFPQRQFCLDAGSYQSTMKQVYGPVAEGCIALQQKVGHYSIDRSNIYKEKEAEIKKVFEKTPKAEDIKAMLAVVGLEMGEFYKTYGTEKIEIAKLYAKDLKDRYTVLWMYYDLFGDGE